MNPLAAEEILPIDAWDISEPANVTNTKPIKV